MEYLWCTITIAITLLSTSQIVSIIVYGLKYPDYYKLAEKAGRLNVKMSLMIHIIINMVWYFLVICVPEIRKDWGAILISFSITMIIVIIIICCDKSIEVDYYSLLKKEKDKNNFASNENENQSKEEEKEVEEDAKTENINNQYNQFESQETKTENKKSDNDFEDVIDIEPGDYEYLNRDNIDPIDREIILKLAQDVRKECFIYAAVVVSSGGDMNSIDVKIAQNRILDKIEKLKNLLSKYLSQNEIEDMLEEYKKLIDEAIGASQNLMDKIKIISNGGQAKFTKSELLNMCIDMQTLQNQLPENVFNILKNKKDEFEDDPKNQVEELYDARRIQMTMYEILNEFSLVIGRPINPNTGHL